MTTIVSIDGGPEPVQNDLIMDASASVLPGVAVDTASPRPGDIPCETVEAFRAAMAGSLSENAAIDRELKKVMVALPPLAKQAEVGGQRSEVEGQRSEVEGQRSEVRGQRSEVEGQRSEVRGQRSEVRGQRSEVEGQRSEVRGQRSEVRGQRSEVEGQTKEGNLHCLTSDLGPRTSHLTSDLGPRTSHLTSDLGPRSTETFARPGDIGRAGVSSPAADGGGKHHYSDRFAAASPVDMSLPGLASASTIRHPLSSIRYPLSSEDDLGRTGVSSPAADGEGAPSSEVLVAAGVQPAAVPAAPSVEVAEKPVSVSSVDVVRAQAATTPLTPAEVLVQAAEAVADTLLVTPGLLRGQGEVVIRLRPDVLEGTDVRIAVTGRQLEVVFQPQTLEMAVMIENCRTQITSHLAAKIATFNVTVDVRKKKV